MSEEAAKTKVPDYVSQIVCGPVTILWLPDSHPLPDPSVILDDEEKIYAATYKAVPRRREYERTRWLIRTVLGHKGPLPRSPAGVTTWPTGWIGSISHKEGHCAIVVEPDSHWASLGLDVESIPRVREEFATRILRSEEETRLREMAKKQKQSFARMLAIAFSFKEALFKAHYPLGEKMFYFHDAEIVTLDFENKRIAAEVKIDTSPLTPAGSITHGSFCHLNNQLIASVAYLKPI